MALLDGPDGEYSFDLNIYPPNKISRKNGDLGLRDINYHDIYWDHLNNSDLFSDNIDKKYEKDIFLNYILCPRISNEALKPYKRLLQNEFAEPIELEAGHYMLVTGNRMDDGSVLSKISFFNLPTNDNREIEIIIRKE